LGAGVIEGIGVRDGVAYVGTRGGMLAAADMEEGRVLWKIRGHGSFEARPRIQDGALFVGSGTWLMKIDAKTGNTLWEMNLGSFVRDTPLIVGKTIIVRTNHIVFGLEE
jgi:outer membrane protein assembly factor BamB